MAGVDKPRPLPCKEPNRGGLATVNTCLWLAPILHAVRTNSPLPADPDSERRNLPLGQA